MRRRRVCEKLALVPGKLDHATIAAFQVADRTSELAAYKVISRDLPDTKPFFFTSGIRPNIKFCVRCACPDILSTEYLSYIRYAAKIGVWLLPDRCRNC